MTLRAKLLHALRGPGASPLHLAATIHEPVERVTAELRLMHLAGLADEYGGVWYRGAPPKERA